MSDNQASASSEAGSSNSRTPSTPVNIEEMQPFRVYKPSNTTYTAPIPQLPDEYFIPTAAELKAAQDALAARSQALTNAPLQLRAVREANERAKQERWPSTTIRVRFTDRTQLERTFQSTDKIKSVYAFVRGCLREDVKPVKFVLYQPPKRELKVSDGAVRDKSLADLQLAPSSVLLLKFLDESLNGSDVPAPLDANVLSRAVELPPPRDYDNSANARSKAGPTVSTSSKSSNSQQKIPKWLKIGLSSKVTADYLAFAV